MQPTLTSGARIRIEATEPSEIAVGDVLAFRAGDVLMAHRVVACVRDRHGCQAWIPRGDALTLSDRPVALDLVVGVVTGVLTDGAWEPVRPAPDSRRIVARAFTLAAVWLARVDLGLSAAWSEGCVWLANRTVRRM